MCVYFLPLRQEKDGTSLLDMKKVEVGKDAAIEAEVKAARERAAVPVEIRMKQFRDMLAEKEVWLTTLSVRPSP